MTITHRIRRSRRSALALVAAFAASIIALVVAPAAAQASTSQCGATYFCVWNNTGYTDGPAQFAGNNQNWTDFAHSTCPSGTWNDCASSAYNHGTSGKGVNVYIDSDYRTASSCIPAGAEVSNLSSQAYTNGKSVNNSISSNVWTSTCHF